MNSTGAKIAGTIALIAISVFFGIDIASSGLERVQGPHPSARTTAVPEAESQAESKAPSEASSPVAVEAPAPQQSDPIAAASAAAASAAPPQSAGALNRLSLALGDGLRYLAQGAIRMLADLIGAILH